MSDQDTGFFPEESEIAPGVRLRPLIIREAGPAAAALTGMDPWLTLKYSAASLQAYLSRPDPHLQRFGLDLQGELAGVVSLRHPWLLGPYLETLGLFPSCQGRGLGQAVLKWLEAVSRGRAGNLWATVSAFNHRARRFYARAGFLEVGVLEGLVRPGFDEILLRHILPPPAPAAGQANIATLA